MDIDELLAAGKGILDDVTSAVESKNYSNLKNSIGYRILTAGDSQRREAMMRAQKNKAARTQENVRAQAERTMNERPVETVYEWQNGAAYKKAGKPHASETKTSSTTALKVQPESNFLAAPVSKNTGMVKIVAGAAGAIANGIFSISSFLFGAGFRSVLGGLPGVFGVVGGVFFMALTALFTGLLVSGIKSYGLMNRYYQYGAAIGKAEFFSIQDMATKMGISARKFLADLKKMMQAGFLPKARLDRLETTMMLTDHAYDQYVGSENSRIQRETEEAKEAASVLRDAEVYGADVANLLRQGKTYIKRVREVNDKIPDTDSMSDRLYRLEEIMNRIFDQVKKQPEQAGNLRRFMDYYLPTIEKLLNGYLEMSAQPNQTENIVKTKKEIEGAIDMVNDAFEKLLDSFFQDKAWDLSSDISVMKTMLTQDGLVE